jgi:hypothetical protein
MIRPSKVQQPESKSKKSPKAKAKQEELPQMKHIDMVTGYAQF